MRIQGINIKKIKDLTKLEEGKTYIIKYAGLFVIDELIKIQYNSETGRNIFIFQAVGVIAESNPTIYPIEIKRLTEIHRNTRLNEGKAYIVKLCGYKQILEYCGLCEDSNGKINLAFYGRDFEKKVLILPENLQAWSYTS